MNAPVVPERLLLGEATPQLPLPLARPGVLRWVWEGRFGTVLIEVEGDEIRVDGQRVEPHRPSADIPPTPFTP